MIKVGNGNVSWKVIVGFLSVLVMLITIVSYGGGLQAKLSKIEGFSTSLVVVEVDINRIHVEMATLKECVRNTELKLGRIEDKLDSIIRNSRADARSK